MSFPAASALGEPLRLSRAKGPVDVLDIAAGSGVWGIALAKQSPHVKITAVDWPEALKVAERGRADTVIAPAF